MIRVNLTAHRCKVCKAPIRPGERYCDPCGDEVRTMNDEYGERMSLYDREDYLDEQLLDEPGETGDEGGEG